MNQEQRARAYQIVMEALDQAAEQRRAFIEAAAGDDKELAAGALEMLAIYEDEGGNSFLETPAQLPIDQIPEKIGAYTIVRPIGEGGMGVVFLATQEEPVKREVAVKVLKSSFGAGVARFVAEYQVLGRMRHANVATYLDAGTTPAGNPWFAMEYCPGNPIHKHCEGLPLADVLRLFLDVCAGIEHAHQKGVIHRDIKPNNIMVTAGDQVKIIDFGIAKDTDDTDKTVWTRTGQIIGTPVYMAPEMTRTDGTANLDTRADVYALGAVLYQLLTGHAPFDTSAPIGRIFQAIEEHDPEAPSTCTHFPRHTVAGDLDAICHKAMHKERGARYATVAQLAEDVTAHIENRPVTAAVPSFLYKAGKAFKRNRATFTAGAIVLLALLVTVIFSLNRAHVAQEARKEAEAARIEAEDQARRAITVTDFLTSTIESADPYEEGRDVLVSAMLDEAAADVDSRFANLPHERASIHQTLGRTYLSLGREEAAHHIDQAAALAAELYGTDHIEYLTARYVRGLYHMERGEPAKAAAIFRDILDAPGTHVSESRRYGAHRPDPRHLAREKLAHVLRNQGKYDEAATLYAAVIEADPANLTSKRGLATAYGKLQRYDEAQALYLDILSRQRATLRETHPDISSTLNSLANIHRARGNYAEAVPLYDEALSIRRVAFGDDHPRTGLVMVNMALTLYNSQHYTRAEELAREAVTILTAHHGPLSNKTLVAVNNLGIILDAQEKYADASELKKQTYQAHLNAHGEDHPDTLSFASNWAFSLMMLGQCHQAEPMFRRTLKGRSDQLGPEHQKTHYSRAKLGMLLVEKGGDSNEAQQLLEVAYVGLLGVLPNEHYKVLETQVYLAYLRCDLSLLGETASKREKLTPFFVGRLDRFTKECRAKKSPAE